MPRNRANDVSDEQIVSVYEESRSTTKVAALLGVGVTTVHRVLKKKGIAVNGLHEYRQSAYLKTGKAYAPKYQGSTEEILEMYKGGLSIKEIAKKIGRSSNVVALRVKRAGISRKWQASGPDHSMWQGGRMDDGQGYIKVWVEADSTMSSMRDGAGYIKEHRLVLARKIGRPLLASETVHHIDGNRSNNTPDNLQLRQGKHGNHTAMHCMDCGSTRIGHKHLD